ncbi:MAG: type II toxin-antitoxin system VapB family antitoxin [Cyanobacteria bacterium P01_G01_bin.54]
MTQLTIDPQLLQEALALSDHHTADELISAVLREYIQLRKQYPPAIPVISDAEQQKIESELGTPADIEAEEFVDLTEWTENAGQLQ